MQTKRIEQCWDDLLRLICSIGLGTASTSLNDADLVVLVIDATRWNGEDDLALGRVAASGLPAIAAVNKIDRIRPRERLLPYLAEISKRHDFVAVVPVWLFR